MIDYTPCSSALNATHHTTNIREVRDNLRKCVLERHDLPRSVFSFRPPGRNDGQKVGGSALRSPDIFLA